MNTVIVDYESGNLHSAEKAFQRMAAEVGAGPVTVTSDPEVVRKATRIVLPGDGAFPACQKELYDHRGLFEAIEEVVIQKGQPFFGICIGMQMLATRGMEYSETPGFDWISGTVERITPADTSLKVPHMGWNDLMIDHAHPVFGRMSITQARSRPWSAATISSARSSTRRKANPPACA
jgi:glutamine amidotransferase